MMKRLGQHQLHIGMQTQTPPLFDSVLTPKVLVWCCSISNDAVFATQSEDPAASSANSSPHQTHRHLVAADLLLELGRLISLQTR